MWKPKAKRLLGRAKRKWGGGGGYMDSLLLSGLEYWAVVDTAMNIFVHKYYLFTKYTIANLSRTIFI